MIFAIRWLFFIFGVVIFSFGITVTLNMQRLGVHPWDVLNVALYEKVGLSIGSWAIIISILLIIVAWIFDKSYIKLGTFLNGILVGVFVDFFLWLDVVPNTSHYWTDIIIMILGIILMGIGGGLYNSAQVGSGPRDGFMFSIADKVGAPIGRIRIITESLVVLLGLVLGGPVFLFTFIFTFIQSPIFAFSFRKFKQVISLIEKYVLKKEGLKSGT